MPRIFQLIFILVTLFPSFLLAQQVNSKTIHHQILAQISPEKHEIKVVDVITLAAHQSPLFFLLHEGETPKISGKAARLKKLSDDELKQAFPEMRGKVASQNVPVAAYRIDMPTGKNQLTLEYVLNIYHAEYRDAKAKDKNEENILDSTGIISSTGVYLGGESLWYPRFNNEMVSFQLSVKLPAGWKSVSQGERLYVENEKSYHLDTWQENNAQNDIYLVAAKFTEYSQPAGNVNAMAFLRDADDEMAKRYLDATVKYLQMYERLVGSYPYKKFALVENFWATGFGMPSFTLLGQQIIRFPFILYSSYPHELLHNWWANSVYVNYDEGNWAEGLTSYLADYLLKEQRGRGVLHRRSVLQKYTNFTQAGGDFALKDFVTRNNDVTEAVGYGKTLMLFHMLRQKLGDDVFVQALQIFYTRYRFQVAGFSDIESTFSEVSGQNLKLFFRTWVQRVGAPDLKVQHVSVAKTESGKFRLQAILIQQQADDAYALEVPVAISLEGKPAAVQQVFSMHGKSMAIDLVFDSKPVLIQIDPEFDIFRRLDLNETPASLSQAFGAAESVIIIAAEENPEMKAAYEQLAISWQSSRGKNMAIAYDTDFTQLPTDKVVWLLGAKNKFRSVFMDSLGEYPLAQKNSEVLIKKNKLDLKQNSVVLMSQNPKENQYAFAFVSADRVAAVSGLGRKLPHYGKYSYLGFEGDAPTNVLKGQWPTIHSPLSVRLSKMVKPSTLLKRRVLIDP